MRLSFNIIFRGSSIKYVMLNLALFLPPLRVVLLGLGTRTRVRLESRFFGDLDSDSQVGDSDLDSDWEVQDSYSDSPLRYSTASGVPPCWRS